MILARCGPRKRFEGCRLQGSCSSYVMHDGGGPTEAVPGLAAGDVVMVEAAGQLVCLFRDRLDYAITPTQASGAGRVIQCITQAPDPSAGPAAFAAQPVYESLQGRPEVGPLPTPRRHLVPPSSARQASPM